MCSVWEHIHKSSKVSLTTNTTNTIDYIALYCNRFLILFIQIIQTQEDAFSLTAQYLEKYSSQVQQLAHRGWHRVKRQEELLMEEGEELGDGRAEGSSATRDGGQAAISLMPDADGTHVHIFESSQLTVCIQGSYYIQREADEPL